MQERDYERRTLARCCRRVSKSQVRLAVTIRPVRTRRHRIEQLTRSDALSSHHPTGAHEATSNRTAHKKHTCTRHRQRPRDVRRVRDTASANRFHGRRCSASPIGERVAPVPLSAAERMRRASPRHAGTRCVACRRSSSSYSSVVREVREPCAGRTSGVSAVPLPQGAPVAIRDLESDIESQISCLLASGGSRPETPKGHLVFPGGPSSQARGD